jgi:tetrahydromethanopterin:alpha-L-glutamate ligase
MRFGIVVSDPNDWTAQSIRSAFAINGLNADFLNFSELSASIGGHLRLTSRGISLTELDGLVIRDLGQGKSHDMAFRFEVLRVMQELGMLVVNSPEAIAQAANKFATSLALERARVPTPRTVVTSRIEDAMDFLASFGTAVSKPLFGYKGRGIVLVNDEDEETLRSILESQGIVYLQEFIRLERPRDIRVFVVDGEVLGAIYRVAPAGAWISNLAQGGKAEPCLVSEELRDLTVRACRALGAIYSGVDLLETADGLRVIEVNGTPSGKGIYEALGVDVTRAIASYILRI